MKKKPKLVDLELNPFQEALREVLKNYPDAAQIGRNSPLATPYFLGHLLRGRSLPLTAEERGRILWAEVMQALVSMLGRPLPRTWDEMMELRSAAIQLRYDDPQYAYLVLELQFFQQFLKPKRISEIWESGDYLASSKATHNRHVKTAIVLLSEALLNRLRPTLRLETPPLIANRIGYRELESRAADALHARQTVTLSGLSGMGKTTLGAAIVDAKPAVFWFTFRAGLNDQLHSLLFCLAYFLHTLGESQLWHHLLVDAKSTVADFPLLLSMAYEDLAAVRKQAPILCFDDLDVIKQHRSDDHAEHQKIRSFLESLRGHCAMIWMCIAPFLEADLYLTVDGLTIAQIAAILRNSGILYNDEELAHLYAYTAGNPRMILLIAATVEHTASPAQALAQLDEQSAIQLVLYRLWSRFDQKTRRFLCELAVYRGFAPLDVWSDEIEVVSTLVEQRLLQQDQVGGIAILPALRALINQQITIEQERRQLHTQAAAVYFVRGEYTEAVFHYVQAGEENQAIHLWESTRALELQRGQAGAARQIFQTIAMPRLGKREGQSLSLIRAELDKLHGEIEHGRKLLEENPHFDESEVAIRRQVLLGEFLDALGYPHKAVAHYEDAIAISARLLQQVSETHVMRAMVHVRQKELTTAWEQADRAEFMVISLRGILHEVEGDYQDALQCYQNTLRLAERIGDKRYLADIYRHLAKVTLLLNRCEEAVIHTKRAIDGYHALGDVRNVAGMHDTIASVYLQMQRYEDAIVYGKQALAFFKTQKDPYRCATIAADLAEAYFEVGDPHHAQQYAYEVLDQEQPQARPYALYTLARISTVGNRPEQAIQLLTESIEIAQQNRDRHIEAYAWRELASVQIAQHQWGKGRKALQEAARLFTQLNNQRAVAQIEADFGRLNHSAAILGG